MKQHSLLPQITSIYITALLLRPILASKIITILGISFPGGLIAFPLSFICNDIFTEVYGYEKSRSIVWSGFFCQIFMCAAIYIVMIMPGSVHWNNQQAYETILGQSFRTAAASLIGYFAGEITNSQILSRMKYLQVKNQILQSGMAKRFILSTVIGELLDSVVYITVAFYGILPLAVLINMIVSTWVLKSLYEFVFLPVSTRVVQFIKRIEGIDVVDYPESTSYSVL